MMSAQFPSATALPRNLSHSTAREIGLRVVRGDWPPGTVLPDEPSLCALFDVSRTVVREAIKMLSSKGMLEVRPRRGTTVLPRKRWSLLDPDLLHWHQTVAPSWQSLAQMLEVRRIVEPEIAALAAERADLAASQAIRAAADAIWAAVDTVDGYIEADVRFHSAVLAASGNEYLEAMAPLIFSGLNTSVRITNPRPEVNRSSAALHEAVATAIEQRDPEAARRAMKTLLSDARARVDLAYNPQV